jgi:restriction system protein
MARYEQTIVDDFSGEIYFAKSNDYSTLMSKIEKKRAVWAKKQSRQEAHDYKEEQLEEAERLTEESNNQISEINSMLKATLDVNDRIDWKSLHKSEAFTKFKYELTPPNKEMIFLQIPKKSFLEIFFKSIKIAREEKEAKIRKSYEELLAKYTADKNNAFAKYEESKKKFEEEVKKFNESIDAKQAAFESQDAEAILEYIELVLEKSSYPEKIDLSSDIFYDKIKRTVIVNMALPNPDDLPKEIEFKYNKSKDEITSKEMKKKDFEMFYDNAIAQICIRTIHEIFEAVYIDRLDFVVFNGWVEGIDSKTGNTFNNCIVSVQAEKKHFESLNLKNIKPLDCLKGLKGLVASEFINLAPVKPIMNMNKNDKRIIQSDSVIEEIGGATNLAEIEWQKFEVLIRDLFKKEFSGDGVEVNVTQASRDAGVDAIIFDPDPIKGGKFVIQCKRYNNVVGVGAVRDLYGTLMNEGAVKGILVTTSHYGKDSMEFAKDKPITLINGQELIYLLNKHGVNAQISVRK